MEQRRLRLGDILDDYCPRERRVTNHAVVAMIGDDIKQTRCTTCDAEHPYKGGKEPRKRKKDTPGALYREVLAGMDSEPAPVLNTPPAVSSEVAPPEDAYVVGAVDAETAAPEETPADTRDEIGAGEARADIEEGPVHRPLIRATLPRPEGQKDARPLPEFTVRYPGSRGNGSHRGDRSRGPGGTRPGQGGQRVAGGRSRGRHGGGFRPPQQPRHGGRKRSR